MIPEPETNQDINRLKPGSLTPNWQYIPLIYHLYIASWGVICYLPPTKGTRNSHSWYPHVTGEFFEYCSTCGSGRMRCSCLNRKSYGFGRPSDKSLRHSNRMWVRSCFTCAFGFEAFGLLGYTLPENWPSEIENFIFQPPTIIFFSGNAVLFRECVFFCSMNFFRWTVNGLVL